MVYPRVATSSCDIFMSTMGDELMLVTIGHEPADRLRAYQLIAAAADGQT